VAFQVNAVDADPQNIKCVSARRRNPNGIVEPTSKGDNILKQHTKHTKKRRKYPKKAHRKQKLHASDSRATGLQHLAQRSLLPTQGGH